ncbi:hypothetical protein JD844_012423 [Phrynosoma platyrhinos]|uniref:LIM zinc-binding domain-containing protein n=1 Tax=Phrynosoma platyrhinos TaxID=52577 RepID=A0ABQ7TKM6_PHRPL|nr:hypothetical protein JD844_012423 [Phrynosoma platyrhinos]
MRQLSRAFIFTHLKFPSSLQTIVGKKQDDDDDDDDDDDARTCQELPFHSCHILFTIVVVWLDCMLDSSDLVRVTSLDLGWGGWDKGASLYGTNWLFCSQVSMPDLSSVPSLKAEPGYGKNCQMPCVTIPGSAAPKTAPVSGPASRPPWAVDPSFAERYAPDKTSTVLSKHSQPATPTPMQNRNSIVQAAQQAPESASKTPVCYQCNKIIRGRYLVALGRYYHPEEFTCSQCRKVLDEGGFFEEKGSIFCPKCYDIRYAPSCAKCKKKITGVAESSYALMSP